MLQVKLVILLVYFVVDVKIKATSDSNLNASPELLLVLVFILKQFSVAKEIQTIL